jgi:DNA-binding NtrC family response regulator
MRGDYRVLVVDDEDVVRLSYAAALASANCELATARSGAEALRAMEREPCDVVFLDLRMPGQDGMSVLREMKAKWPESEYVIVTGYPSVDTAKEAVRLGAFDYLAKPVGPDEIVGSARGAITRKQWALRDTVTTRSIP